jgi:hypothetical protein
MGKLSVIIIARVFMATNLQKKSLFKAEECLLFGVLKRI